MSERDSYKQFSHLYKREQKRNLKELIQRMIMKYKPEFSLSRFENEWIKTNITYGMKLLKRKIAFHTYELNRRDRLEWFHFIEKETMRFGKREKMYLSKLLLIESTFMQLIVKLYDFFCRETLDYEKGFDALDDLEHLVFTSLTPVMLKKIPYAIHAVRFFQTFSLKSLPHQLSPSEAITFNENAYIVRFQATKIFQQMLELLECPLESYPQLFNKIIDEFDRKYRSKLNRIQFELLFEERDSSDED